MSTNQTIPVYPRIDILKALLGAFGVAVVLLVLFVLPAEYGFDPTGLGKALGVTNLSVEESNTNAEPFEASDVPYTSIAEEITLEPDEGLEFKLHLNKGNKMFFSWTASAPLYYDFHGEPDDENETAFMPFKSYQEDVGQEANGFLDAEFMGKQGWYWRNDTGETVTINLRADGFFEVIGIIQ
jgi:hypothetical protein